MTYCDFKVGDEVAKRGVNRSHLMPGQQASCRFPEGTVLTISAIQTHPSWRGIVGLVFEGVADQHPSGYDSRAFRKVIRTKTDLSLEAFFKVPGGYEEPKRSAPAKKRERV